MRAEVTHSVRFEAAHFLPDMPGRHKCKNMHGHSYEVTFNIAGDVDPVTGIVIDYDEIDRAWAPLFKLLDHRCLNEVDGMPRQTTSENLARWIWERIRPALPGLTAIAIAETCTSGAIYRGG